MHEEVNGCESCRNCIQERTVNMLTNYMKYNYKYNDNKQDDRKHVTEMECKQELLGKRFVYPLYIRQQECNYRILQMEFQERMISFWFQK